ncbi:MAG: phage protein Gp37 [Candidatus Sedimenticola sp. 6PFRAG7]
MSIALVENHLVELTAEHFGSTLRADALPSAMNIGLLKSLIPTAPAVYWAFLGGRYAKADEPCIDARWVAYVMTRHVGSTEARRHGDKTTIGAYPVIAHLAGRFHDRPVPDMGFLKLRDVNNLFSMQLEASFKSSLYAITFELLGMPLSESLDEDKGVPLSELYLGLAPEIGKEHESDYELVEDVL